jgi:hypothetical protein
LLAAEPRSRPRLILQPRSKPEEPTTSQASQASIFGGAKPVDTAAREKEIEERLEKEKGEISRLPPRDTRNEDNRYRVIQQNCFHSCRSLNNLSIFIMV